MNTAHTSIISVPQPIQGILGTLNNLPKDPALEISENTILKEQLNNHDVLNKKGPVMFYLHYIETPQNLSSSFPK